MRSARGALTWAYCTVTATALGRGASLNRGFRRDRRPAFADPAVGLGPAPEWSAARKLCGGWRTIAFSPHQSAREREGLCVQRFENRPHRSGRFVTRICASMVHILGFAVAKGPIFPGCFDQAHE